MKLLKVSGNIVAGLCLTACATSGEVLGLSGQRTVFHNPYAAPELANGGEDAGECEDCQSEERVTATHNLGRDDIRLIEERPTRARTVSEQRAIQRRNDRRERRRRERQGDDRPNPAPWPNGS